MDLKPSFADFDEEKVTTPVGRYVDRVAPNGTLTTHQAALTITVFGHRMSHETVRVGAVVTVGRASSQTER